MLPELLFAVSVQTNAPALRLELETVRYQALRAREAAEGWLERALKDERPQTGVASLLSSSVAGKPAAAVSALRKDSPAVEAGLRPYDVLVEINGTPVSSLMGDGDDEFSTARLQDFLLSTPEPIAIKLLRFGRPVEAVIARRRVLAPPPSVSAPFNPRLKGIMARAEALDHAAATSPLEPKAVRELVKELHVLLSDLHDLRAEINRVLLHFDFPEGK